MTVLFLYRLSACLLEKYRLININNKTNPSIIKFLPREVHSDVHAIFQYAYYCLSYFVYNISTLPETLGLRARMRQPCIKFNTSTLKFSNRMKKIIFMPNAEFLTQIRKKFAANFFFLRQISVIFLA